jgi:hypothetical protein
MKVVEEFLVVPTFVKVNLVAVRPALAHPVKILQPISLRMPWNLRMPTPTFAEKQ